MSRVRIISRVVFCTICCRDRLFIRLRRWPGEAFHIGDCGKCGNTQAIGAAMPTQGPGSAA